MIFKLAYRNILKNLRRSIVSLILGIICCAFLILYQAINEGGRSKMIADSVEVYNGYLQMHGKGYQDHPNYDNLIFNLNELKALLKNDSDIKAMSARLETFALFSGQADSVGGMLIGIEPENEDTISRIKKALKIGRYLKADDTNGVYLGADFAKKLEANLGDELIYVSTAMDYSQAAGKLKIIGIFQSNLLEFDSQMAFINKTHMDQDFLAENIASSIVILPKNKKATILLQNKINKKIDRQKYEIISYKESMKDFLQFMKIDDAFGQLTLVIFLIIVFFVIMIFALISVFQRTREIGIMRAIGTTQKQIFLLLIYEGLILAIISVLVGGLIGYLLSAHFAAHPLAFKMPEESKQLYSQHGFVEPIMPAYLSIKGFLMGTIPVFFLMVLGVVFPAWKINKLKPIDAIEERS